MCISHCARWGVLNDSIFHKELCFDSNHIEEVCENKPDIIQAEMKENSIEALESEQNFHLESKGAFFFFYKT